MTEKPTSRSRRPRFLGVLVAVCLAIGLSAVPGVAAAAPPQVEPFVDCYRENTDGTYTVVFGYSNTKKKADTIPYGAANALYPAKYQGSQPQTFAGGTQRGVFSLRLSAADLAGARWVLDGTTLDYRTAGSAPQCAPSTPLPLLGNGAGLAIALVAGGVFGVLFVRRIIRRAGARPPLTTSEGVGR